MLHPARNLRHLAGTDDDVVAVQDELQPTAHHTRHLLLVVRMPRDDAAAFQLELCDRHSVAGDVAPGNERRDRFTRNVGPTMTHDGIGRHVQPPVLVMSAFQAP